MTPQKPGSRQVRIIAGRWKGRRLRFDGDAGLRPTLGKVRETLFNWLQADIVDATVLDLFAGSGALAFEALSRGAAHATLVERNRRACQALARAVEELDASVQTRIVCRDALSFLHQASSPFDVIFLDPPFRQNELLTQSLAQIAKQGLASGQIYVEAASPELIELAVSPHPFTIARSTRVGDTAAVLLTPD